MEAELALLAPLRDGFEFRFELMAELCPPPQGIGCCWLACERCGS
jgi:hypothetical protein